MTGTTWDYTNRANLADALAWARRQPEDGASMGEFELVYEANTGDALRGEIATWSVTDRDVTYTPVAWGDDHLIVHAEMIDASNTSNSTYYVYRRAYW